MRRFANILAPLVAPLVVLATTGCGSTKLALSEALKIAMTGAFETPADAAGNAEPRFETFTLTDVTLLKSDGTTVDAYEDDAKDIRIISRPQIIHEQSLTDDVGTTFSGVLITFDATMKAGGKYEDEMSVALATPAPSYVGDFTVEKATGLRLDIKVQWKNTVTRDEDAETESVSSPSFILDLATD